MTITTKNEDGRIECFYDSDLDKDKIAITVPSGRFGLVVIQIDRTDLPELVDTLQSTNELMRAAGAVK